MTETRTDWSAVLAGAVLATAIALVLVAFGTALGLGMTSPYEGEGASRALFATAAGVWLLWIQLASFSAGGYVVGRLRARRADESAHETDVRDGLHGLLVWGVGVIAAAVISFGAAGAAGAAAGAADRGPAAVIAGVAGEETGQTLEGAAAEEGRENLRALDEALAERQAEVARKWSVLAAFATAAALLAGAVAAFFCAHVGGNHRDRNVVLPFFARTPPAHAGSATPTPAP
jgi:hypothetical protein